MTLEYAIRLARKWAFGGANLKAEIDDEGGISFDNHRLHEDDAGFKTVEGRDREPRLPGLRI